MYAQLPHVGAVAFLSVWVESDQQSVLYSPKQQRPTAWITALRFQWPLRFLSWYLLAKLLLASHESFWDLRKWKNATFLFKGPSTKSTKPRLFLPCKSSSRTSSLSRYSKCTFRPGRTIPESSGSTGNGFADSSANTFFRRAPLLTWPSSCWCGRSRCRKRKTTRKALFQIFLTSEGWLWWALFWTQTICSSAMAVSNPSKWYKKAPTIAIGTSILPKLDYRVERGWVCLHLEVQYF